MQVNYPFKIEIIIRTELKKPHILKSYNTRLVLAPSVRPTSFKWLELNTKPDSPKLIKWIEEEFKPLFNYDPLLWLASVGTCPEELRKHLIPFHKEF